MASELDRAVLTEACKEFNDRGDGHHSADLADGLRAYVTLSPAGSTDLFCLRMDFGERIAAGPPSVTFCNPTTKAEGQARDWPRGFDQYFKPPPQNGVGWICNPWTREGRQHHPEWNQISWVPTRVVWRVGMAIQDILDKPGMYCGRAG